MTLEDREAGEAGHIADHNEIAELLNAGGLRQTWLQADPFDVNSGTLHTVTFNAVDAPDTGDDIGAPDDLGLATQLPDASVDLTEPGIYRYEAWASIEGSQITARTGYVLLLLPSFAHSAGYGFLDTQYKRFPGVDNTVNEVVYSTVTQVISPFDISDDRADVIVKVRNATDGQLTGVVVELHITKIG